MILLNNQVLLFVQNGCVVDVIGFLRFRMGDIIDAYDPEKVHTSNR